ncbi:hypothetical protein [Zoogloea sp.]|uniref:hypothetical protein n=1 Tax=Zoogloea sp. TaxID=49181 RepID=UPI0035B2700C
MALLRTLNPMFRLAGLAWLAMAAMAPLPAAGAVAPTIHLPVAATDSGFRFDIPVLAGQTYFIDPPVAIGYTYAIGAGDPSFRSVLLPVGVGDGLFDLFTFDPAGTPLLAVHDLPGGVAYDFGPAGVERFRVGGIEVAAGLDPASPTAFVAGLGFTGAGRFTGTQTPLVVAVSEPALGTLLLLGMGLLVLSRWRLGTRARRPAGGKLTKGFFRSRL